MKKIRFASLTLLALITLLISSPSQAQDAAITLKLGTLAPEHSAFDNILQDMAAEWSKAGVALKIYGNGVLGEEPDIITKMRINQIQMGVVTVVGLSKIDKAMEVKRTGRGTTLRRRSGQASVVPIKTQQKARLQPLGAATSS